MRRDEEWEAPLFGHFGTLPTFADLIAVCKCGRREILPRRMRGVHNATLFVDIRNRLKCSGCRRRGVERLLIRKKPR